MARERRPGTLDTWLYGASAGGRRAAPLREEAAATSGSTRYEPTYGPVVLKQPGGGGSRHPIAPAP